MEEKDMLQKALHYNPISGNFVWLISPTRGVKIGDIAGELKPNGYRIIQYDNQRYYAHRLAYFFMKGFWPPNEIDHKDNDRDNNVYSNLRECSHTENAFNKTKTAANTSGYKGVTWVECRKKWQAQIRAHGKYFFLGRFKDVIEAARAYDTKAKELHGEFARVNGV